MNTATNPPQRELTLRALITGLLLGALLTPCNIYTGLKIGWSFNMSITALLLGFGLWSVLIRITGAAPWGLLESNISQTSASASASIISGGLVAPIPALAMMTGENLPLMPLMAWVFCVSFLGVWVAWYLQPRLVVNGRLPFPAGIATAETMRDIFSHGQEAARRVWMLLGAAALALAVKLTDVWLWAIPRWAPGSGARLYTFTLDPSLLLLGFGAIIGFRTALSLLAGAVLAWALVAPELVAAALIDPEALARSNFGTLVEWLLWPGVALMVATTLSTLAVHLLRTLRPASQPDSALQKAAPSPWRRTRCAGLMLAGALCVLLQHLLFGIDWWLALSAIPMAFMLAVVAARVAGETGIPPIGAIGKVSQLGFGVMAPGQIHTNLMTANVAGGAAGQCSDLLNDFRAGHSVGANPARQIAAQIAGIMVGSLVGSVVYLALIPDPANQLVTTQWPAPAVATWKAVAETLSQGLGSIPLQARWAMLIAALAGVLLGVTEALRPEFAARWLPSGAALGLAFVIPASTSIMLFAGAALALIVSRLSRYWAERFLIASAAGLIAGESLYGVIASLPGVGN